MNDSRNNKEIGIFFLYFQIFIELEEFVILERDFKVNILEVFFKVIKLIVLFQIKNCLKCFYNVY